MSKKNIEEWDFSKEKEEERKRAEFADFLEVGEIAGNLSGVPHSHLIPSEVIINSGETVQVSIPDFEGTETPSLPTVMVHRDGMGAISAVEVICTCGRKVRVDLAYDKEEPSEPVGTKIYPNAQTLEFDLSVKGDLLKNS